MYVGLKASIKSLHDALVLKVFPQFTKVNRGTYCHFVTMAHLDSVRTTGDSIGGEINKTKVYPSILEKIIKEIYMLLITIHR